MTVNILTINEILSDPEVRGGKPVIAGTTLRVSDIVLTNTTGDRLSAEQIAEHYQLSLGQIYAALAYYHLHKSEIDAEIQADVQEANRLRAELERQGKLTPLD
jgi:uncharacterized protein (DUF433 family)